VYGDHIIELQDGGALLDPANVMLRCAPCHGRKTAAERDKRMAKRW
jgi:5-methylcytosine-specific restriction protein A